MTAQSELVLQLLTRLPQLVNLSQDCDVDTCDLPPQVIGLLPQVMGLPALCHCASVPSALALSQVTVAPVEAIQTRID